MILIEALKVFAKVYYNVRGCDMYRMFWYLQLYNIYLLLIQLFIKRNRFFGIYKNLKKKIVSLHNFISTLFKQFYIHYKKTVAQSTRFYFHAFRKCVKFS